MEAIRFLINADGDYYTHHLAGEGEYYHKPEADAEIARLEHQIEVLNADLTRCQDSKTAIGDKCLRLEGEVERLTGCLIACIHELQEPTNAKEEILRIAKQAISGGR